MFWEIKLGDVDRSKPWACEQVEGSQSIHSICGFLDLDLTLLKTRELPCFCDACLHNQWRSCSKKSYIHAWKCIALHPTEEISSKELQVDQALYEGSQDFLGNFLEIGDNFATNTIAADEGVDFLPFKMHQS